MVVVTIPGSLNADDKSKPAVGLLHRSLPALDGTAAAQRDLVQHLIDLVVESWWDLDANEGRRYHEYFTEDGTFDFAGQLMTGRGAIEANFDARRTLGDRTTLHMLTNLTGEIEGEDTASVRSYICVFGADGVPLHQVRLPNLLGLMQDDFRREADGRWRIVLRTFRPMMYQSTDRVARGVAGL
jgi:ketosteroid isomerase-like protein